MFYRAICHKIPQLVKPVLYFRMWLVQNWICGWSLCGVWSCFALAFQTGSLQVLSQQMLVDCSWGFGNNGCDGGEEWRAYEWIMKHGGIATTETYGAYMGMVSKMMCSDRTEQHCMETFYSGGWGLRMAGSCEAVFVWADDETPSHMLLTII